MSRQRAIAVIGLLVVTSCADGEFETIEGTPYNANEVQNIAAGESADDVLGRVGQPDSRKLQSDGAEEWRYYWRCRGPSWVHIGQIQVRAGRITARSEATILMRNRRVERVVKDSPWVHE